MPGYEESKSFHIVYPAVAQWGIFSFGIRRHDRLSNYPFPPSKRSSGFWNQENQNLPGFNLAWQNPFLSSEHGYIHRSWISESHGLAWSPSSPWESPKKLDFLNRKAEDSVRKVQETKTSRTGGPGRRRLGLLARCWELGRKNRMTRFPLEI